ncbi:MAG: translation elongation factor 4 [Candidatus Eremiobacteraeota bacterium]|nr:translation elongation factor 4 [Candidatus Eremiobacteraeota bacterium]
MEQRMSTIRNFSIIAHIDHGKSTLADRLLEFTGTIAPRQMADQVLDKMELERERGITIKAHPVTIDYHHPDGETYRLNLIDTPGHVDFTYEVSRSLAACDGALLVVDASQGVEAQTLANYYLAMQNNLEVIPVINKIDLPVADPPRVKREIEDILALPADDAVLVSAKEGIGTREVLEAIVKRLPPPKGESGKPLRALIFDSQYDSYRGVILFIRLVDGTVGKGTHIRMMSSQITYEVDEVGIFKPEMTRTEALTAGDVGYLIGQIKDIKETRVGDTVTLAVEGTTEALPGYREVLPMVYCGLYPVDNTEYGSLRDALEKLQLNDASLVFEPENSLALGFGFRCGFLGLLHMEIIQERLEREYDLTLIATAPSVVYRVYTTAQELLRMENPSQLPDPTMIEYIEEPLVKATVMCPESFVGAVMDLCQNKRGIFKNMECHLENRYLLTYEIPFAEIITDFFDQLKSRTRGYASLDYEPTGYQKADLIKLDILVHGEKVDALSLIVHKDDAYAAGKRLVENLKDAIPRHLFVIPIQAAAGGRIIARETISAMRKNVLAKCYGGDITRKRKLLEKQKKGKKRMKTIGNVDIPQEAFLAVLKVKE